MFARPKKLGAYPTYLILGGASAFFTTIIVTLNSVYQLQVAHLNPLQLVLVGTVLEISCFLTQVPTGVLADVYSRRLAIIIGIFLIGVGFILEGAIPRFETILLAQVIWGIGATFTDGADSAWITDEIGEERVGNAFLRASQIGQVAALVAIPISVALGSERLNLPILLGGGLYLLLGVFLIVFMPEQGFKPTPRENRASGGGRLRGTGFPHSWLRLARPLVLAGDGRHNPRRRAADSPPSDSADLPGHYAALWRVQRGV